MYQGNANQMHACLEGNEVHVYTEYCTAELLLLFVLFGIRKISSLLNFPPPPPPPFFYVDRYFAKVAQEALCLDWTVLLGVLLLDEAIVRQAAQWAGEKLEVLTVGGVAKVVQEMEDLSLWASVEWYVNDIIHV